MITWELQLTLYLLAESTSQMGVSFVCRHLPHMQEKDAGFFNIRKLTVSSEESGLRDVSPYPNSLLCNQRQQSDQVARFPKASAGVL